MTRTFTPGREGRVVEERVVEELRGEEPGTGVAPGGRMEGAADEPFEIVLRAEQVVPTTVVVPVERIRVGTRVVTSDVVVSADPQRERVGLDLDDLGTTTAAGRAAGDALDDTTGAHDSGARTTKEEPR